jgi:site-specific DNA-adenine methylase
MEVLEPIPTKGLTLKDMDDLMTRVYQVMADKNDELRARMKQLKESGQLPDCRNL